MSFLVENLNQILLKLQAASFFSLPLEPEPLPFFRFRRDGPKKQSGRSLSCYNTIKRCAFLVIREFNVRRAFVFFVCRLEKRRFSTNYSKRKKYFLLLLSFCSKKLPFGTCMWAMFCVSFHLSRLVFAGATRNILVLSEKPYQDLLVCIKFSASRSGQQDIGKLGYLGTEIKIHLYTLSGAQ